MTTTLGELSSGTIVNINEADTPVPFYVAQQDYESDLNGIGRTLLVRKDVYDQRQWNSSNTNVWANCTMQSWLNDTYKALLDTGIQSIMGTTKYYYTPGNGNTSVTTRSDAVFLLSMTELGQRHQYANVEGSALPIASTLKIAYKDGYTTTQWTRSPNTGGTVSTWNLDSNGGITGSVCTLTRGSRPAFTLPSSTTVLGSMVEPIPIPTITIPSNAMQGQPIPISWTAVDNATNYQLQRNTGLSWETIYTGSNTFYQDTAGSWSTAQYQVAAQVGGVYGLYGQSNQIPVISASTLAISGTDEDLGTITKDIGYTITSNTGNQINLTRTVNGTQVASLTVNSGFAYNIPIADLPTGEGSIVITASVQSSTGLVTATRNWTYTKTSIDFSSTGGIAQLTQNKQNIWPITVSDAVQAPAYLGGNLNAALNILSQAALYKTSPNKGLYDILGNSLLSLPITPGTQIATGSYVGTGKYGSSNPNSLTFEFDAKAVFVNSNNGGFAVFVKGTSKNYVASSDSNYPLSENSLSWPENSVKWWSETAGDQLNESGTKYYYTAIG